MVEVFDIHPAFPGALSLAVLNGENWKREFDSRRLRACAPQLRDGFHRRCSDRSGLGLCDCVRDEVCSVSKIGQNGLFPCFAMALFRWSYDVPILQPLVCLFFPYLSYLISESVHMSGILAWDVAFRFLPSSPVFRRSNIDNNLQKQPHLLGSSHAVLWWSRIFPGTSTKKRSQPSSTSWRRSHHGKKVCLKINRSCIFRKSEESTLKIR